MRYLVNAFSVNMLSDSSEVTFRKVTLDEAKVLAADAVSAVGHAPTATFYSRLLQLPVEANRVAVTLSTGDSVLVGALGARLDEGRVLTDEELQKFPVTWWYVEVR